MTGCNVINYCYNSVSSIMETEHKDLVTSQTGTSEVIRKPMSTHGSTCLSY